MSGKIFYGWRVVTACFIVAAFVWALAFFGSSVYLQAVTKAHGWSVAEVSSAISMFFFVSALVQGWVGRAIARTGPRPVLLLGALCMMVAVAAIGQVDSVWQLYPCFILLGMGWATLSTTGISATVAPWFERYQGRSITLAIMGASFGAILGVPILLFAIDRLGLSSGLLAVGAGSGVVLLPLIAIVLRYRGPADLGQRRDGDGASDNGTDTHFSRVVANDQNRRRLIWTSTIAFSLALVVQNGFITHHVVFAQSFLGAAGAGLLVSATGVVALIGRIYLLKVIDVVPVRRLACQAMAAQFVSLMAIGLFPNVIVVVVASLVYGFALGNVTTLSPIVVRREFGAEAFGATYGSAATFIQFTTAFGPACMGYMHQTFGGYSQAFSVAATVTAIGCAVLHFGRERPASTPSASS